MMTTEQFFTDLASAVSLGLNDDERELIEKKQNGLREKLRLDEDITLEDDFLTGSYRRHTILKPKDADEKFDVDVFIAFSNDEYGEKDLEELREITIKALRKVKENYPELGITGLNEEQARSVGVEFGGIFQIDVVPSIQIEKDKLYKIFDKRSGQPVRSNPKLHGERLTEANEQTASGTVQRLVPIVKLLKAWKREKCDYMKSFHLEILAVEILGNEKIESYSEGIAKFFANAVGYLREACLEDPANPDNIIDEYLDNDGTRNDILDLINSENIIAGNARELEDAGDDEAAVQAWKKIFSVNIVEDTAPVSTPIIINNPPKPHAW